MLMIIMGLQVALKKPLCIDSNIVYKIDKVDTEKTETIYACNQFKKVSFSGFFYENLNSLQARIVKIEMLLNQLNISGKFAVVIDNVNKTQSRELINGIQIGVNLLDTKQFEKTLLQLSLKNDLNTSDIIFLQSLSDFFIGDSIYQNPISEAWGESFKELSSFEKIKIFKQINSKLMQLKGIEGMATIEKLKSILSVNQKASDAFCKRLKKAGYYSEEELNGLRLDIVIEEPSSRNVGDEITGLAREYPHLKIAIKNANGFFLLPSNLKVPETLAQGLFAKYRMIFDEQNKSESDIVRYFNNSESLILIHSNTSKEKLNLISLFRSGVNEFLSQNKQIDFVQIHLPSYKLVYKNLGQIADYFEFVGIKNLSQTEHKALGWSRTEWLKDLQAYRPIANFDVIQYFRIN